MLLGCVRDVNRLPLLQLGLSIGHWGGGDVCSCRSCGTPSPFTVGCSSIWRGKASATGLHIHNVTRILVGARVSGIMVSCGEEEGEGGGLGDWRMWGWVAGWGWTSSG